MTRLGAMPQALHDALLRKMSELALKLEAKDATPFVGPPVDLAAGAYYWTVVGTAEVAPNVFVDTENPWQACAAGRVQRFSISSRPATTGAAGAFASGLSSTGRVVSAAHTAKFHGEPLVAWTPAAGANIYEVQWSRDAHFSVARGSRYTFTTSAVLPLRPGTWRYRVRGFDYNLPTGAQAMAWSRPAKLVVAAPQPFATP